MSSFDADQARSAHVYARLSGFGWTLLPHAPFRFERVPHRPELLLVETNVQGVPKRAKLDFSRPNPAIELNQGTDGLEEILDFTEGPMCDHWRIETTVYSIRWPEGFAVQSQQEPPGFDLLGPNGTLIFLQGPFDPRNLPPPAEMVGEGQSVHQLGRNWVELSYLHDGVPWRQTHRLVAFGQDVVVVTSQAPAKWNTLVSAAAVNVSESLSPTE
jgi:hypothetical protein